MSTHAYIDSANLHKGIQALGWKIDYKKFRTFLTERYGVTRAFYFIGHIKKNKGLYEDLAEWGYDVAEIPVTPYGGGHMKGNCDVYLAVQALDDFYSNQYEQAIIISGDGELSALAYSLVKKDALKVVLAPNHSSCSHLLRKGSRTFKLTFLEDMRHALEYKK